MKTIQALIDDVEYGLKSKGTKYYDRVAIACFNNEPILIDPQDIQVPKELPTKQKQSIIDEAIRRIFDIVHKSYCKESHTLAWTYGQLQGQLLTDLPEKVWVRGSRHQIRRFIP